jgi:hypothetical protein
MSINTSLQVQYGNEQHVQDRVLWKIFYKQTAE